MSTKLRVELPRPHSAQQRVIDESARWNVVNCGRRFGKTTLGINRAVPPTLDGLPVGWFSPTYKMLSEVWREAKAILQPIVRQVSEQEKRLILLTGGLIDFWSLDNPDVARGRKYARAIVDEAAMVKDLENAWNAVIRPTLTDYKGDGWFLSTPRGWDYYRVLYQRGQDPTYPDWRSWSMPTTENPYISPSEVEAARHELPERIFAQEYLAVFLEDGGGVFRRVLDATTAQLQDAAEPAHEYIFGVDWGKLNDFTVITVIDATAHEVVTVDRFNQIDYATQVDRLTALAERFLPFMIVAEMNSMGVPLIEQLQRRGMPIHPFTTTNATKQIAIDSLALAFERGVLRIPNDPILIAELQAYEAERLPSGMIRYGAPEGMHDDCVMSLALAWLPIAEGERAQGVYVYDDPVAISPY